MSLLRRILRCCIKISRYIVLNFAYSDLYTFLMPNTNDVQDITTQREAKWENSAAVDMLLYITK